MPIVALNLRPKGGDGNEDLALRPEFTRLPEAFAPLMLALVGDYSHASRAAGTEPDTVLLAPILEALARLEPTEGEST